MAWVMVRAESLEQVTAMDWEQAIAMALGQD